MMVVVVVFVTGSITDTVPESRSGQDSRPVGQHHRLARIHVDVHRGDHCGRRAQERRLGGLASGPDAVQPVTTTLALSPPTSLSHLVIGADPLSAGPHPAPQVSRARRGGVAVCVMGPRDAGLRRTRPHVGSITPR